MWVKESTSVGSFLIPKKEALMYKIIPWDDPDTVIEFSTWLDTYQYGSTHYGMRFDLIEE